MQDRDGLRFHRKTLNRRIIMLQCALVDDFSNPSHGWPFLLLGSTKLTKRALVEELKVVGCTNIINIIALFRLLFGSEAKG